MTEGLREREGEAECSLELGKEGLWSQVAPHTQTQSRAAAADGNRVVQGRFPGRGQEGTPASSTCIYSDDVIDRWS